MDGNLVTPEAGVSAYADATVYAADAIVMHNGVRYKALTNHTSESATEPGVGASWDRVGTQWEPLHYAWDGAKVLLTDHAEGLDDTSRSVAFSALTANISVPAIAVHLGLFPKASGKLQGHIVHQRRRADGPPGRRLQQRVLECGR